MYTPIIITLITMTVISGLFASSTYENKETNKPKQEGTILEKLGVPDAYGHKKYMLSKISSLAVFVLSIAGLITVYFVKG